MKVLYFDTTQDWIQVLIANYSSESSLQILSEQTQTTPKESSYKLVEYIRSGLEKAKINKPDLIIVASGPGSFTGIRITVTTARDLSQLWKIPVFGVDSLEAYLAGIKGTEDATENSLLCLDGKQGKYYTKYKSESGFSDSLDLIPEIIETKIITNEWTPNNWYYTGNLPKFYPPTATKIEATNLNLSSILQYSLKLYFKTESNQNDYLSLLPNYIRGTYVDHK
ncbi:tRNA (adenosine(37)-N6)-threonylcarbamoyltransferase complex dimerization subunit type 1 TsaB [Leptospira sp. 2 VSF19]|uniref:tRNA (Adenosine(37)-N6)-threonylcarbamoyltransferase complex dimerization subunit type 1 TsaB n=1 Tax=Leptospira soteropolitanensis TaxID=2950025 RepID=A0AAW5VFE6_9LEPT|nr:tRNA (adenosine(37)-N6)-threonylcarbamoyltransferase complex dimerization subunit type 1 TsaB [Leptospira soteropolitanensis]MCW7491571.1 tRNA (adenosine(37)-N6)-threonylcarbamoyltransferase complex dimerization subunit type 1 TsaB [Leptospira soteropolitanensis]MCW7499155.1 tRNA (adenosine(37)-N6)-threonylcarbamoyltransferase complex dimerization subunit type 1 TsaB [Leptospira soteropolitanensis]MCW7521253.1 tRNA (adenosine(37)-N6)-threonylcarbamoyltransferase complex dimerization subunit t